MLIVIDTEEALNFSLSVQDCAVLDVIRKLLNSDKGAVETEGSRFYKWLSDKLILQHLQCPSFKSTRQLYNIIKKLCACGLIIKKTYYGKPYYSAIMKKTATQPRRRQSVAVLGGSSAPAPAVPPSSPVPSVPPSFEDGAPSSVPPTAAEVSAFAAASGFSGFDVNGFISYNTERNWAALNKTAWRVLAQRWFAKQRQKESAPITYEQFNTLQQQGKAGMGDFIKIGSGRDGKPIFRRTTAAEKKKMLFDAANNCYRQGNKPSGDKFMQMALSVEPSAVVGDNKKAEAATSASSFKVINMSAPINDDKHLKL
jgi:hypothetical protein